MESTNTLQNGGEPIGYMTLDDATKMGLYAILLRKEAAQVLRKSPRTLERWAAEGKGPKVTRIGNLSAYTVGNILKHLKIDF